MMQNQTLIQNFFKDQICLIVEPSQAFAASIQHCLNEMNISLSQVLITRKFEDAQKIIREMKPRIVITEYDVESHFGLALLEVQAEYMDDGNRVSIIVTKNNSDSAVAEAAEEQIDAYIVKPFSPDVFKQRLLSVFEKKVNPSDYAKKIREGKQHLALKEWNEALSKFLESKPLDDKPTLACSYAGYTYQILGDVENALKEFREGRRFQPLHYKCLIGEFENLMTHRDYTEAYKLVGLIRDNYPITSHRLGQIFIAAVFTQHFEDLSSYYQLFQKMEQRPARLTELTSLALLTAGRVFLAKKDTEKACEYFNMGFTASAKKLTYLEKVITELLNAQLTSEAESFLLKAHPSDVGTSFYNQLSFRIDRFVLSEAQVIEKGRKLVAADEGTPEIFHILVEILAKADKTSMAESIISKALVGHPDLRASLYGTLEKNSKAVCQKVRE